ncbi:MAG: electron transport complex subunit RsxD [Gammaproteobacteria bacterium]|nr:electron transport complex subunit RsxD [Gammaproteobacteria bacterium]
MQQRLLIATSPYRHREASVRALMLNVLYALLPGIGLYVWFFGWGVVVNAVLATLVAVSVEAAMLFARRRPLRLFLTDGSAVVTAVLLALALPPLAPWWVTVTGTAFAIAVAKHLYGGLGFNPFNPAMVGYVVLLISFPREMTMWPAAGVISGEYAGFLDSVRIIFMGSSAAGMLDAITGATPLDLMKTQLGLNQTVTEILASPVFGDFGGKGWEWLGNGFFLGGIWLLYKRVITWHIPVAVLTSLFLMALIFSSLDPGSHPSPLFHLFSGGAMLGAFFIATDPVSAATTPKGRLVYGAGIGILTYIIREWGGYPDGIAFAVLLMNMATPTIDYYTQPRTLGHEKP